MEEPETDRSIRMELLPDGWIDESSLIKAAMPAVNVEVCTAGRKRKDSEDPGARSSGGSAETTRLEWSRRSAACRLRFPTSHTPRRG